MIKCKQWDLGDDATHGRELAWPAEGAGLGR